MSCIPSDVKSVNERLCMTMLYPFSLRHSLCLQFLQHSGIKTVPHDVLECFSQAYVKSLSDITQTHTVLLSKVMPAVSVDLSLTSLWTNVIQHCNCNVYSSRFFNSDALSATLTETSRQWETLIMPLAWECSVLDTDYQFHFDTDLCYVVASGLLQ